MNTLPTGLCGPRSLAKQSAMPDSLVYVQMTMFVIGGLCFAVTRGFYFYLKRRFPKRPKKRFERAPTNYDMRGGPRPSVRNGRNIKN